MSQRTNAQAHPLSGLDTAVINAMTMTRGRRIAIRRCFVENSRSAVRTVRLTIRYL
jgi:hypothetical protein